MSKQSMLQVLVEKAKQLNSVFRINGKATDGTTDVQIEALKSVTNLNLKPSDVISFSNSNVNGLVSFLVDGNLLLPSVFAVTTQCQLVVLDIKPTVIAGILINPVTNDIYNVSGKLPVNTWTAVGKLADQRDITNLITTGVDKFTNPFLLELTGDGEALLEIHGNADVSSTLNLKDIFKGIVQAGTEDPNTTTKQLIYTVHSNAPDATSGWYILSYRHPGGFAQIAMSGSGTKTGIAIRHYINSTFYGSWTWLSNNRLSASDIPSLDASKVTSGVFDSARLPSIPSGSISSLDASKITTGVFDHARLPTGIINGSLAYANTSATYTGRIKITTPWIPTDNIMLSFDIIMYSDYKFSKYTVSGNINSSTGNWFTPKVIYDGVGEPDITLGKGANGKLYVSVKGGQYYGLRITNLTLGNQSNETTYRTTGWTITEDQTTPDTVVAQTYVNIRSDNIANHLPDVPASKITSGVLAAARIPNLDASKITTGILSSDRIPELGGDKIPSLDASKITTGVLAAARVPVLNQSTTGSAAKLTTARSISMTGDGTWSTTFSGDGNSTGAMSLSATGVTAGTYAKMTVDVKGRITAGSGLIATDIPVLDASKITTGVLADARVPVLDASKVTTGTFDVSRIPSLDASKVTTGAFSALRIPALDTSKITTGVFDLLRIPTLPASKLTGVVPVTTTINGKPLAGNITLSASDVGALKTGESVIGDATGVLKPLFNTSGLQARTTSDVTTYPSVGFIKTGSYSGNVSMTDAATYSFYKQDGTTLANISGYVNASNLNMGTVPVARLPAIPTSSVTGLDTFINGQGLPTGSGTQDPNVTTEVNILTTHANCPLPVLKWHITTRFQGTKSGTGNMSQMAIAVDGDGGVYTRTRYSGVWSDTKESVNGWCRLLTGGPLGNIATKTMYISTTIPDDSTGEEGDMWGVIIE